MNYVGATIGRPPWRNPKNNICGQSRTPVPTVKIEEYHCLSRKYATFAVVGADVLDRPHHKIDRGCYGRPVVAPTVVVSPININLSFKKALKRATVIYYLCII